jgi:hypothetical protein
MKKMMPVQLITLPFAILFLIAGCSSLPQQIPFTDKKRGETEVGESARAYVGDIIYRKFDIKEQFRGFISGSIKIVGCKGNFADVEVQRMLIDGSDGGVTKDPIPVTCGLLGTPAALANVSLTDSNSDGTFETYNYMGQKGKLKSPIMVDWEQSNRSSGFRRELLYQGRDGDNLKLFYREYNDDFRRSSYDQEVQYDLGESNSVQFRGLTILIEDANNEYLVYTISGGSL